MSTPGPGQGDEAFVHFSRAKLTAQGIWVQGLFQTLLELPIFCLPLLVVQGAQVRLWNTSGVPHILTFSSGHGTAQPSVFLAEWQGGDLEQVYQRCGGTWRGLSDGYEVEASCGQGCGREFGTCGLL